MKRLSPESVALAVVLGIAAGAFVVSYTAITEGAVAHGVPSSLAPLFPLMVDGFQTAAYLIVSARALRGEGAPWAWWGVAGAGLVSLAANVAQAPPTWPARAYFAIPPVALFLGLKYLGAEYRASAERRQLAADPGARARAYWYAEEVIGGRKLTARELGEVAGIPRTTARDWAARWRAELAAAPPIDNHQPPAPEPAEPEGAAR
jgi:hypothetical protein